ncbi:hypothetical protein MKX01_006243 [Papaver californicum]|nr:hypothetical protein MKX01_006243 [Papaver californicum]
MKMKIFSFLPKLASVTFQQNPPFSPGRENNNKLKSHVNKGFSGQLIPDEVRRKSSSNDTSFYSTQEPTSPKVSCMGQIKLKKKVYNSKSPNKEEQDHQKKKKKRIKSKDKPSKTSEQVVLPATFSSKNSKEENKKKFDYLVYNNKKPSLANTKAAPSLDQMKRFASGRESLANFDWRDFDDDGGDGQEEEDEVFIAHSAPLMMGGGGRVAMEPKKEINLWKRRTTTPPKPLQINVTNKDK